MKTRAPIAWMSVLFAASAAHADGSCAPAQSSDFQGAERIVASLRLDKPGQARVFAFDGSEFTAGQALWMQAQLNRSSQACARGDGAEAAKLLSEVQELIKAHARRR